MKTNDKPQATERPRRRQARTTTTRRVERAVKQLLRDPALADYTERGWFEQQVCREAP